MSDTPSDTLFGLNPDGSLDTTFGPDGTGIVTFPDYVGASQGANIVVDGSRILLAGYTYDGLSVFALTLNGTWDNTFGQNGVAGGFDPGADKVGATLLANRFAIQYLRQSRFCGNLSESCDLKTGQEGMGRRPHGRQISVPRATKRGRGSIRLRRQMRRKARPP